MSEYRHPARPDAPHSGVFRSVYFLTVATAAIFVVLTAIFAFYDPPEGEPIGFPTGFEESEFDGDFQQQEEERDDYNRNVSLILAAVSAAVFAAGILGLGSRFNPLRAGLVLGGLIVFLIAMGFWSDSSDQWIGFLMTLINFGVLAGSFLWLEEGLPLKPPEPPRRLRPSDIAPPPPPAPPHADFEPSAPMRPSPEPPPGRSEAPPPMSDLPHE